MRRYEPLLRRYAHGRLPRAARGLRETQDLVQTTILRALAHVRTFKAEGAGAFHAYLRTILRNRVRRSLARAPAHEPIAENLASPDRGPLEEVISREDHAAYEAALLRLPRRQLQAVTLAIEGQLSLEEVAAAIGCPSANAARMFTRRAVIRLVGMLKDARGRSGPVRRPPARGRIVR
jgi:RNA polymerase sigma-70 factor (ECF subfamily)